MEHQKIILDENKSKTATGADYEANRGLGTVLVDTSFGGFKELIFDFFNIPYQKKKK